MRSFLALAGAAGLVAGGFIVEARSAPIGESLGLRAAQEDLSSIETVQFSYDEYYWNGHFYCWYDFGWRGPGWYVCDYGPWVTGYWWGGPLGWHHWRWRGPRLHGPIHVQPKPGGPKPPPISIRPKPPLNPVGPKPLPKGREFRTGVPQQRLQQGGAPSNRTITSPSNGPSHLSVGPRGGAPKGPPGGTGGGPGSGGGGGRRPR